MSCSQEPGASRTVKAKKRPAAQPGTICLGEAWKAPARSRCRIVKGSELETASLITLHAISHTWLESAAESAAELNMFFLR